jgi:tripeptide aminopeptidase
MSVGRIPSYPMTVDQLAETRPLRECLQWFTKEKQWINERHLELCRIPAPTFLEQARAEWLVAQMRSTGWRADLDPAGNMIAIEEDAPDQPLIAIAAHLDTVLAPRHKDEISVGPDGVFHGPGVSDNGAGLAGLLALAKALRSSAFRLPGFVLAATVGEEGEGNLGGMRYLAGESALARRIQAYIVLDGPALDRITTRALASRRMEVAFTGPGGHSWSDYGTANPVHALGHAISLLASQIPPPNDEPRSAFNFGMVEGGSSINSIPVLARAKIDIRSESEPRLAEWADTLASAVAQALERENRRATGGKLTARVKELGSRPSGELTPQNSALLAVLRAIDAHLGIRARLDCSSTDANIPLSLGLPALAIGAGGSGGGGHTPAEWYDPEGRDLGLKRVLLLLALLLR